MRQVATALVCLLVFMAANLAAQVEQPEPKSSTIEVTLTELRPPRDALGKFPEGWDKARLERAGGLYFEGRRSDVGSFVRIVEERGAGKTIVILCDPTLPWTRLRSLFRVLNYTEAKLAGVEFATTRRPVLRQPLHQRSFDGTRITIDGNGNIVEESTVGGGNLAGDEKADEGKKIREVMLWLSNEALTLIEDGENGTVKGDDQKARLASLKQKIEEKRAGFDLVRLQLQPDDAVSCATLLDVMISSGADRHVISDFGGFGFSFSRFIRAQMTTWLPMTVDRALANLKRLQSPNGAWNADPDSGYGIVGATALALLAYTGEFHSPTEEGTYQKTVQLGLAYLLNKQRDNGCFAGVGDGFSFAHVLATYALIEVYGITGEDEYLLAAEKALRFLVRCRNEAGVWGLIGADPKADLVVTAWATQALSAADTNGLDIPEDALEKIDAWLDENVDAKSGRVKGERPTRLAGCVDDFYGRRPESLATVAALEHSERLTECILTKLDTPANAPDGLEIFLFAGDAIDTVAVVTPDADGGAEVVMRAPGDQTVLRTSARLDERVGRSDWTRQLQTPIDFRSVYLLFTDHLKMTSDSGFSDNVLYLLLEDPRRRPAP